MKFLQLCLVVAICAFLYVVIAPENKESMIVEYVVDGDTFQANGQRVRVWGIDSPEREEPYYQAATDHLRELIDKQAIECVFIDQDKYKRAVMRCYFEGDDISKTMVRAGMARDFTRYSDGYYKRAENIARQESLGIWQK